MRLALFVRNLSIVVLVISIIALIYTVVTTW